MRKLGLHPRRARVAVAVALGASALALAGPAGADTKASIACRGAIAKGLSGIPKSGFKLNDKCHKTQDKAAGGHRRVQRRQQLPVRSEGPVREGEGQVRCIDPEKVSPRGSRPEQLRSA